MLRSAIAAYWRILSAVQAKHGVYSIAIQQYVVAQYDENMKYFAGTAI